MPEGKNRTTVPGGMVIGPQSPAIRRRNSALGLGSASGPTQANPQSLTSREVGKSRLPAHKEAPRQRGKDLMSDAERNQRLRGANRVRSKKGIKNVKRQVSEKRASKGESSQPRKGGVTRTKGRGYVRAEASNKFGSNTRMGMSVPHKRKTPNKNPPKKEPR